MAGVAKTEVAFPGTSTLEMLPAELPGLILSHIVDLSDLSALVHASPVFYQQYRSGRERLLCECLKRTLGSVFVNAYIRQASSRAVEQTRR